MESVKRARVMKVILVSVKLLRQPGRESQRLARKARTAYTALEAELAC